MQEYHWYEKKSERSEELHTGMKPELKCAYTKKNDLSLELDKGLQLWFLKIC